MAGFDPGWRWYVDEASLLNETEAALKELMDQGYAPENIVILTFRGAENSMFFSERAPRGLNAVALSRARLHAVLVTSERAKNVLLEMLG